MISVSTLTRQLSAALRTLLVLTVVCGVAYPLVVLGVGQVVAHGQANGSLLERNGSVVASSSLGQQVPDPQWFQGRRSASEYAGNTSGGSNLGTNDPKQAQALSAAKDALVIVALIPLALRGVRYRPSGAAAMLRRNLLVYGLGGVITPFIGIKLIDLVVSLLPGMT